jgi:hypothetical protein
MAKLLWFSGKTSGVFRRRREPAVGICYDLEMATRLDKTNE